MVDGTGRHIVTRADGMTKVGGTELDIIPSRYEVWSKAKLENSK